MSFYSDKTYPYFKLTVDKAGRWPYINNQLELTSGVTTVVENIYMKLWDSGLEPGENPTPDDNFAGGDGSIENPYQIATARQLDAVRNHLDSNFVLVNDIDLSEYSNWVPIGGSHDTTDKKFNGIFDGGGHVISNLKMHYGSDAPSFIGLFGLTSDSTEIKNLELKKVDIMVGKGGYIGTICASAGKIENCVASGNVYCNAKVQNIGGIAALSINTMDCTNYVNIDALEGASYVAGVVAKSKQAFSCKNYGDLNIQEVSVYCGGIIADERDNFADVDFCVSECYNFGDVNINLNCNNYNFSVSAYIGGIVGYAYSDDELSISNSNNHGNINIEISNIASNRIDMNIGGILGQTSSSAKLCGNIYHCGNYGNMSICVQELQAESISLDVSGINSGALGKVDKCMNAGNLIIHDSNLDGATIYMRGIGTGNVIECYNMSEKIGLENTITSPRRISISRAGGDDKTNCSIDSTLILGGTSSDYNGDNITLMPRAEIEKAVTDLGFELPGQTQYIVWKGIPQTVLSTKK